MHAQYFSFTLYLHHVKNDIDFYQAACAQMELLRPDAHHLRLIMKKSVNHIIFNFNKLCANTKNGLRASAFSETQKPFEQFSQSFSPFCDYFLWQKEHTQRQFA